MNISKKKKMYGLFGLSALCAAALLIITCAGGVEPGADCPEPETFNYVYKAPPYKGQFTLKWAGDEDFPHIPALVELYGHVDQVGQSTSVGDISEEYPAELLPAVTQAQFKDFNPQTLRGTCLDDFTDYFPDLGTSGHGFFPEIVAVGKKQINTDGSLTLEVLIMEVDVK